MNTPDDSQADDDCPPPDAEATSTSDESPVIPLVERQAGARITDDACRDSPVTPLEDHGIDKDVPLGEDMSDWPLFVDECKKNVGPKSIERKAAEWHVSPDALRALDVGFYENGHGFTFPMRASFPEDSPLTGLSKPTVNRAKNVLRNAGVLTWRRGHTDLPNVYRLHLGTCRGAEKYICVPSPVWRLPAGEKE
jgi:hypothetical protein